MATNNNTQVSIFTQTVTMSSREIAKLTGKQHKHVLDDCRTMFESLNIQSADFSADYKDSKGRTYQEYLLNQELTMTLVMGYSIPLRHKVVKRWQELEQGVKPAIQASKSYLPEFRHARAIKMVTQTADTICSRFPNLSLNSQQAIFASLVNPIAGENVVPLPMIENKTYSATEVGQRLGISANKVGSIANKHGLKVSKYGYYALDKAKYSDKHVETFRYNDEAIQTIKSLA